MQEIDKSKIMLKNILPTKFFFLIIKPLLFDTNKNQVNVHISNLVWRLPINIGNAQNFILRNPLLLKIFFNNTPSHSKPKLVIKLKSNNFASI